MDKFFNLLANGARSLSFTPTMKMPEFEYKSYKPRITLERARTPAEIMRSAWEEVGNRMWEAIGEVEKEHGPLDEELQKTDSPERKKKLKEAIDKVARETAEGLFEKGK